MLRVVSGRNPYLPQYSGHYNDPTQKIAREI
jgi:hypothetical protein